MLIYRQQFSRTIIVTIWLLQIPRWWE
jgi:hypothetical protein